MRKRVFRERECKDKPLGKLGVCQTDPKVTLNDFPPPAIHDFV